MPTLLRPLLRADRRREAGLPSRAGELATLALPCPLCSGLLSQPHPGEPGNERGGPGAVLHLLCGPCQGGAGNQAAGHGSSGAGFFFWEKGEIRSQSTYLEFPFDRRELEAAEEPPAAAEVAAGDSEQPCEATPTVAEDIPLPSFLAASQRDPKERGISSLRWRSWWVQIPIILALVLLGGWLGIQGGRYLKQQVPQAAPEDPYTLGLTVAEYGDNLHLTWNREAPAIRSARRGLLIIGDGDQSRVLEMDWNQLQNGSVMYRRMTGPVRFRLEVYLKENRVLSESWETPSPPQPASSPQPQIASPRPQD